MGRKTRQRARKGTGSVVERDGSSEGRSTSGCLASHVAPRLLVVADLAERDDARAKLAAHALWSSLRDRLEVLPA